MGKKLRNREVLDETDQDQNKIQSTYPIDGKITSLKIRKMLHKQSQKKEAFEQEKLTKFLKRIKTNEFHLVIDEEHVQCPICLELMVAPIMLLCGHIYCYRCLDSNSAHSQRCCLCRQQQGENLPIPSRLTETLINKFVLPKSNQIIKYLCRTTDYQEWAKRRKINNLRLGSIVDFHDRFNVWRRGVVVNVLNDDEQKILVEIRINIKGQQFFEKIAITSRRLAPYTFFTRGRYLQEFATVLPQFDRTQRELNELEYRQVFDEQIYRNAQLAGNLIDDEVEILSQRVEYVNEQSVDPALILFNFEMNANQEIFS